MLAILPLAVISTWLPAARASAVVYATGNLHGAAGHIQTILEDLELLRDARFDFAELLMRDVPDKNTFNKLLNDEFYKLRSALGEPDKILTIQTYLVRQEEDRRTWLLHQTRHHLARTARNIVDNVELDKMQVTADNAATIIVSRLDGSASSATGLSFDMGDALFNLDLVREGHFARLFFKLAYPPPRKPSALEDEAIASQELDEQGKRIAVVFDSLHTLLKDDFLATHDMQSYALTLTQEAQSRLLQSVHDRLWGRLYTGNKMSKVEAAQVILTLKGTAPVEPPQEMVRREPMATHAQPAGGRLMSAEAAHARIAQIQHSMQEFHAAVDAAWAQQEADMAALFNDLDQAVPGGQAFNGLGRMAMPRQPMAKPMYAKFGSPFVQKRAQQVKMVPRGRFPGSAPKTTVGNWAAAQPGRPVVPGTHNGVHAKMQAAWTHSAQKQTAKHTRVRQVRYTG